MKREHVMKIMTVMALAAAMVVTLAGCTKIVRAGSYRYSAVSGVTEEDNTRSGEETEEAADAVVPEEETDTVYEYPAYSHETDNPYYLPACQFNMEEYGSHFETFDVMIPFVDILRVDDSDPEDIKIWGNYKIFNYAIRGTTMFTMNGGNFPGLIHMKKDGDSLVGVSMDEVESGSNNAESIEKIFGVDEELLEAFRKSTEDEAEEELVLNTFRWYQEDSGLDIEAYEDYGWDPVYFNAEEQPELEYPDLEGTWVADGMEMEIHNPDEGSVYEVTIWADQEDGSTRKYTIYGQYEFSTDTLYYWNSWITAVNGEEEEDLESAACGYLGREEDGTIEWFSVDDQTNIWFSRG